MSRFRISTVNGLLLALYFIPAWGAAIIKIAIMPIRGIYDRSNIAPALFVSDHLQLFAANTVRFAWLLALAKFVVVAFFILFVAAVVRSLALKQGDGDEALAIALGSGGLISLASMILAVQVGEAGALQLHATESLLLMGGLVLLVIDGKKTASALDASVPMHAH